MLELDYVISRSARNDKFGRIYTIDFVGIKNNNGSITISPPNNSHANLSFRRRRNHIIQIFQMFFFTKSIEKNCILIPVNTPIYLINYKRCFSLIMCFLALLEMTSWRKFVVGIRDLYLRCCLIK